MGFKDFLRTIWRRRYLVLLMVSIGLGVVWLMGGSSGPLGRTYAGSTTLSLTTDAIERGDSLPLLEFIATETPEIADLVSDELATELGGDAPSSFQILQDVTATSVPEIGTMTLAIDNQSDESAATLILDRFAFHLIDYATNRRADEYQNDLDALTRREGEIRQRVDELSAALDAAVVGLTPEELEVATPDRLQEAELRVELTALEAVLVEQSQLLSLTDADLVPLVVTSPTITGVVSEESAPLSLGARMLVGAILGGVLGVGLAVALQRFDTRLYNRKEAEAAFGLPVLASVAPIPWSRWRRRRRLIMRTNPEAPASEAYRLLRSSLARARRLQLAAEGNHPASSDGTVILVSSAGARTGKTSTAANLGMAGVLAGHTVLIVSADLRDPELDQYFDVTPGLGLSDMLDELDIRPVAEVNLGLYIQNTNAGGIQVLLSGHPVPNPGERLARMGPMLRRARRLYDLVIIDTPAMLIGNDVNELVPFADLMVAVAKAGSTTIEEAQWYRETAERLQAPVCGVVLVGAHSDLMPAGRFGLFRPLVDRVRGLASPSGLSVPVGQPPARPTDADIAPMQTQTEADVSQPSSMPAESSPPTALSSPSASLDDLPSLPGKSALDLATPAVSRPTQKIPRIPAEISVDEALGLTPSEPDSDSSNSTNQRTEVKSTSGKKSAEDATKAPPIALPAADNGGGPEAATVSATGFSVDRADLDETIEVDFLPSLDELLDEDDLKQSPVGGGGSDVNGMTDEGS